MIRYRAPRVAQNAGLPEQVLLEAIEPHRRIERNGDRPGDQNPLKGSEEVHPRREHEGDGIARLHTPLAQATGNGGGGRPQTAVGDLLHPAVRLV